MELIWYEILVLVGIFNFKKRQNETNESGGQKNLQEFRELETGEKWNCTKLKVSTAAGLEEGPIKLLCSSVLPPSVAESTLLTNFLPSKNYIFSYSSKMGIKMANKLNTNKQNFQNSHKPIKDVRCSVL